MVNFIKNKWSDPVWSKVFAGVILGVGGIVASGAWSLLTKVPFSGFWTYMQSISLTSESSVFDFSKKSNLFLWLSSGLLYLIASVALTIQTLREEGSLLSKIGTSFLGVIICAAISFVFFWIFSFIPQIDNDTWIWNYLVNFGIQLFIVFSPMSRRRKKNHR
jgi:hypothetical protein